MLSSCAAPKEEEKVVQKEEKKTEKKQKKKQKNNKEQNKKIEEQEVKKEEQIVKKEEIIETEDIPDVVNPYDELIAQYRNGLQTGDWAFLDQAGWCTNFFENSTLIYAFNDINQDRIQEMLVTTTMDPTEPVNGLVHVFTICNGTYSLVDGWPGLRSSIGLGYDGVLKTFYFHAGNPDTSISYKYLPANGEKAIEYKCYSCDFDLENAENSVYSVTENGVETIITKEEYDQVYNEFITQRAESNLVWHNF